MENGRTKVWLPAIRAASGADVFTLRLAQALERQGVLAEITWFTRYDELVPLRLMRAVPPPGTDAVITNSWVGHAFKRPNLRLIAVVHHAVFSPELEHHKSPLQRQYHRFFAQPREARTLHSADVVVAVSDYVAESVSRQYGIDGVKVIHNWVDNEKFSPGEPMDRENRPFRLLFVGKPTSLKGADLLVPIMRELGSGFELAVTFAEGDCGKLDFPPGVHFLGRLAEPELIHAYRQCDALLSPSRSEGFGYAALEAMACGKPVVASNAGGLREVIRHDETGLLSELNDTAQFAGACRRLAADEALCRDMGSRARLRAAMFSERAAMAAYQTLLTKLT